MSPARAKAGIWEKDLKRRVPISCPSACPVHPQVPIHPHSLGWRSKEGLYLIIRGELASGPHQAFRCSLIGQKQGCSEVRLRKFVNDQYWPTVGVQGKQPSYPPLWGIRADKLGQPALQLENLRPTHLPLPFSPQSPLMIASILQSLRLLSHHLTVSVPGILCFSPGCSSSPLSGQGRLSHMQP